MHRSRHSRALATAGLAYTVIVVPLLRTLWRGRDETVRDAGGTLRLIICRRQPGIDRAVYRELRRTLFGPPRGLAHPVVVAASIVMVAAGLGLMIEGRLLGGSLSGMGVVLGVVAGSVLAHNAVRQRAIAPSTVRTARIAAAWIAIGRCPSCAYPLQQSRLADRVHCPECGSLWHQVASSSPCSAASTT